MRINFYTCFIIVLTIIASCNKKDSDSQNPKIETIVQTTEPLIFSDDHIDFQGKLANPTGEFFDEIGFIYNQLGEEPLIEKAQGPVISKLHTKKIFATKDWGNGIGLNINGVFYYSLDISTETQTYYYRAYALKGGKVYYGKVLTYECPKRGTWKKLASFPGAGRQRPASFSIGNKGYVGLGYDNSTGKLLKDFWEYDPALDKWEQISDFPGKARTDPAHFIINGKAYVGGGYLGFNFDNPGPLRDFYEFDPATKTWKQKADLPIDIAFAFYFTMGSNGYIGGGKREYSVNMFRYDSVNDKWEELPRTVYSPALQLNFANALVFGTKAYISGGIDVDQENNSSVYEFDSVNSTWKVVNGATGLESIMGLGLTINNKGYFFHGFAASNHYPYHYKFDFINNKISSTSRVPDNYHSTGMAGFVISNHAYIGLGEVFKPETTNNFYEFTPAN
jgi:hypothetical protein